MVYPSLTYNYSDCGPVIEYNLAVVTVVHFKVGLECLNTLLSCVYNESPTFYNVKHSYTYCVGGRICCSFVEQGLPFMYTVRLKEWG